MKKLSLLLISFLTTVVVVWGAEKPKYVFYFIGDGMGMPIINVTEAYMAARDGKIGNFRLFNQFPFMGLATTYSDTRYITDSAAAGTALASGKKTSPGTIGMNSDHSKDVNSIATEAKSNDMGVGIITTVSIDHATPAAFYAHQPSRNQYYEIAVDGSESGFDLLGGSGFLNPSPEGKTNVYELYKQKNYKHIAGKDALKESSPATSDKLLITERQGANSASFAYEIENTEDDLTLSDLVEFSSQYLYHNFKDKGFLLMAEGGMIDWAAHANDAAGAVGEILGLQAAINKAYAFYEAHPDETLIVLTADHETGGCSLGCDANGYESDLKLLQYQKASKGEMSEQIGKCVNWEEAESALKAKMGFGTEVKLSEKEWEKLKSDFKESPQKCGRRAVELLNKKASIGWTTGSHTGSPVMVYAVGAGAENFSGLMDNTDIPNRISSLIK